MKSTENTRRIVLTGASGVGKTSLASLLSDRLGLSLIPEVARQLCIDQGYKSPVEIPDQETFRKQVLKLQIESEQVVGDFVSDRSTIDCWVLWQRWQLCSAMTYDTEAYYESCRLHARNYSHIIYVPPLFPPVPDDFRWTEADYVKQMDRLTRLTLYDWDLLDRTYTIKTDGPDNRLKEVLQWLES